MSQWLGTLITLPEVRFNSQKPSIMGSNAHRYQVEEHADRKPIHTYIHNLLLKNLKKPGSGGSGGARL